MTLSGDPFLAAEDSEAAEINSRAAASETLAQFNPEIGQAQDPSWPVI